jgi:N-acetylglucosamine-6-phosphate deacetylase
MTSPRRLLLEPALLLDPEVSAPRPGALLVEEGRIGAHLPPGEPGPPGAERVALEGLALAPGFVDLHYHGGLVFGAAASCAARLAEEATALLRYGTTAFLPTTMSWPAGELVTRVEGLCNALEQVPEDTAARPLGLHLEGPWIRPEAAGAQPAAGIRPFGAAGDEEVFARAEGRIRMVTLAPEIPGAAALLATLVRRGIVAALGHSLADERCVMDSLERGMTHVTHLFNAMGGLHHRARGVAGVALTEERLTCDLICDGVHVHPQVVRLAARVKGERLLLITDRVAPPPAGEPGFGAGPVHEEGGALRLADGTLAGSSLTLDRALRLAEAFGAMTRLDAVAACTLRPARLLGIEAEHGTLRPGARADFAILDAEGCLRQTWLAGRRVA